MRLRVRPLARLAALWVVAVVTGPLHSPAPASQPPAQTPALGTDAAASGLPEVRLRKLHLVRPDLIPYPIAYEVYC